MKKFAVAVFAATLTLGACSMAPSVSRLNISDDFFYGVEAPSAYAGFSSAKLNR